MSVLINASTSTGLVQSADTSGEIELQSNGTTALKVNTNEGIQILNCLGVGNATPSTSGAGITFPATQSASTDANTLDDYEEGDFTPSITQGNTYSTRVGRYTKIGRVVNFYINIECTVTNGGGVGMDITGLPFTILNTSGMYFPCSVFAHTGWFVTSSTAMQAQLAPNTTIISMFGFQNSSGTNYLRPTTNSVGATVYIELAGSYHAA
jgi:hypothetical protein